MNDSRLIVFNDNTKHICNSVFLSLFLILAFIVSPLNQYATISMLIKLIVLTLLGYAVYLNVIQINYMTHATNDQLSPTLSAQLQLNTFCNYIFTFFLVMLFVFVIRSFF
jgi:hypothetical protein